jgi:hypothetical protein
MGDVRCAQLPNRFAGSYVYPRLERFTTINASSGSPQPPMRALSPMKLGPFRVVERMARGRVDPYFTQINETQQAIIAQNMEGYWQSSKIYNIDVVNGQVQESFFLRRGKFMTDHQPHRRTVPKAKGYPVASYFDGTVYGYLPARIGWYCPIYEMLVTAQPAFQNLMQRHQSGEGLLIIGPDGRDLGPLNEEVLTFAILNPNEIFGHELVLCCLLLGIRPWANLAVRQQVGLPN